MRPVWGWSWIFVFPAAKMYSMGNNCDIAEWKLERNRGWTTSRALTELCVSVEIINNIYRIGGNRTPISAARGLDFRQPVMSLVTSGGVGVFVLPSAASSAAAK